jgi:hypothetical protein
MLFLKFADARRTPSPAPIFQSAPVPREEPEKIRRWREDQQQRLQIKGKKVHGYLGKMH